MYMATTKSYIGTLKILFIILLASIIFSMLYPFYSLQEGIGSSLTSTDITNLQEVLKTYATTANENCHKANNSILTVSGKDSQHMKINSLIKNNNNTNTQCAILEQISAVATDTDILGAINTCYGSNYTAVLNLLSQINGPYKQSLKNDSNFEKIVEVQTKNPSTTGQSSTYNTINGYVMGALAVTG